MLIAFYLLLESEILIWLVKTNGGQWGFQQKYPMFVVKHLLGLSQLWERKEGEDTESGKGIPVPVQSGATG